VAQTEGKDLPEHAKVSGDAGLSLDRLVEPFGRGILKSAARKRQPTGMTHNNKILFCPGGDIKAESTHRKT
jgi:hypothetical protein